MTTATGDPDGLDPRYGSATGPVDDDADVATRRERIAAWLQRSGAFLILAMVTLTASLVFGLPFKVSLSWTTSHPTLGYGRPWRGRET